VSADGAAVVGLLDRAYGLEVESFEVAPRGWTGETWYAVAGGTRVFVKLFPAGRLPATALPALPVLVALHDAGLTELARPIATVDGALSCRLGEATVVVFERMDGARARFVFGGEQRGDLLARIHAVGLPSGVPALREAFDIPYAAELRTVLRRAVTEPPMDRLCQELCRYLEVELPGIEAAWQEFQRIATACRSVGFDLVVTHGDWPFNLIESPDGTLHPIDWDELLLAPPERDTWFVGDDERFWQAYRARRPHEPSALATAFYVNNRYFDELVAYVRDVLAPDNQVLREKSLAGLVHRGWMDGLRRRMAALDPFG
jgi:spectinomycin phosphotransferase